MASPLLLVISGPAGSGKGTVVSKILEKLPTLGLSVSATTRAPRPGETDGVNYFFTTKEDFEERIKNGDILEYTTYCGNYYGTLKSELAKSLDKGRDIILEIEVDGGSQVKKAFPDAVTIMLVPPSYSSLRARLEGRGTETSDVIEKRLMRARDELELAEKYDYIVVNEDGGIEKCADEIISIINTERLRASRRKEFIRNFFNN